MPEGYHSHPALGALGRQVDHRPFSRGYKLGQGASRHAHEHRITALDPGPHRVS
jgi:hypothetical protein